MINKTANQFFPEVRDRAVRLVLDTEGQHSPRWNLITSIAQTSVVHAIY